MEEKIYKILIKELKKAIKENEMPVSAIITLNGKIIAKAHNKRNRKNQTLSHAEIMCITKANKKLKTWRLNECVMYVTMEPCEMCKVIVKEARISKLYYIMPKLDFKSQYNKTQFIKTNNPKQVDNIQNIVKKFWKNKR